MDPKACLSSVLTHIEQHDYADAIEALADYYDWRVKGGVEPPRGDRVARDLATRLSNAVYMALNPAKD